MVRYWLLILALGLIYFPLIGQNKNVIWAIGERDGSGNEFALSPNGYDRFIESGFGSDNHVWVAGYHSDGDFPYVLAGPYAEWAGCSYWAGWALNRLPVYFYLSGVQTETEYTLEISLLDVSADAGIMFRAEVNDTFLDTPLTPGKGAQSLSGDLSQSVPVSFVCKVPGKALKNGLNRIVFQLFRGKYVLFDAIRFLGPSETLLHQPVSGLLLSARPSGYELRADDKSESVLLLDVRNLDTVQCLNITVGRRHFTKTAEKGHTVYELRIPAVRKTTQMPVKVKVGKQLVYNNRLSVMPARGMASIDYVDQFAGSSGSRWMIGPGPWMPFGMVKIMPDNEDQRWKAGYEYQIENIMGFSHIHEWTMAGLLTMPVTGDLKIQPGPDTDPDRGYRSRIDKKSEQAHIGYYGVELTDYDIRAELTATTRASMQRYTFPASDSARVMVDLFFPSEYQWSLKDASVRRVSDTEIEGWAHSFCNSTGYSGDQDYTLHFVMQFSKPFDSMGGWIRERIFRHIPAIDRKMNPSVKDGEDIGDTGVFLNFHTAKDEMVTVRTGISLVSIDNARTNLQKEIVKPFAWDFSTVVDNQRRKWQQLFERVQIETDDYLLKRKFYTNLYRSISPRTIWNDINGEWVDMDEKVQKISDPQRNVYGSDAYWGMHWNLNPFYNMFYPEFMSNWIYTFSEMYRIGGWLPIGNPGMEYFRVMVGAPAVPMIVSAWQHGIRDFDTIAMYKAIRHELTANPEYYPGGGQVGNEDYPDYITKGYVPYYRGARPNPSMHSYVSNTMEYAFHDYAAWQYFKALGKKQDVDIFMQRSENWRNMFDQESGFTRPRWENGEFMTPFDPFHAPGFCEGSSWQFTWYVPQNVPGLVEAMGENRFIERLNWGLSQSEKVYFNAMGDNMSKYPINHGNETNMQSSYLFNFTRQPWLTQKWTRAIQEKYYGTMGPRDAYPGDEDQGQMSAWYVLSSIGFFEMDGGCAVDPMVTIGSPRFHKVTIQLSPRYYGAKELVVEAHHASRENCYIQSLKFNGREIHSPFLSWNELKQGGHLEMEMGNTPNPEWWMSRAN